MLCLRALLDLSSTNNSTDALLNTTNMEMHELRDQHDRLTLELEKTLRERDELKRQIDEYRASSIMYALIIIVRERN